MKVFFLFVVLTVCTPLSYAVTTDDLTLDQIKASAAAESKYLSETLRPAPSGPPKADLEGFYANIEPILTDTCVQCHGPEEQRARLRIDTLDPDLVHGKDTEWWLEVLYVMSNGEMPPPDKDVEIADEDRGTVLDWLSGQILVASQVERGEAEHSSFRRMTRYEFSYALQDLLDLPQGFESELPPETLSEDGFKNSSEMLQMTSQQFLTYRNTARKALQFAAIEGPRPTPIYYAMTLDKTEQSYFEPWLNKHMEELDALNASSNGRRVVGDNARKLQILLEETQKNLITPDEPYILNVDTEQKWSNNLPRGFPLWEPTNVKPADPQKQPLALVLPHGSGYTIDIGDYLPDRGNMKVRIRASRANTASDSYPSLALSFGYYPANNSAVEINVGEPNTAITASSNEPQFYEWIIPLEGIKRNPFRHTHELGRMPNPSENITFRNVHRGPDEENAAVHIDYIEITAPYMTQWPPESHRRIFPASTQSDKNNDEIGDARIILERFMKRAWRRPISEDELTRKLSLFETIRPISIDFQEAIIEVLASVLSSNHFLYLPQPQEIITDYELATRLSFFLWSSVPDDALMRVADEGRLRHPGVLAEQVTRMLDDPRAERLAENFTHQWLGMELLENLQVDKKTYPNFSKELKRSMSQEPIEFFRHVMDENLSIMDFLHADYTFLNQQLAIHYGMPDVYGNHFQKVSLAPETLRGGVLTQAGLLAMNSDGKDSNPLKRGIWLLENLLHDPPPPPPPAVPVIDLTDPRILELTLKERMEDHRNDPACSSCHSKIDPWGIAFEEFDALGAWRDNIDGEPVDATSYLYNDSKLSGMNGLKRYLLENRQDQFSQATVHKLASYALGRPISFADRAELEKITASLRKEGDGLRTLIRLLVESDLFQKT